MELNKFDSHSGESLKEEIFEILKEEALSLSELTDRVEATKHAVYYSLTKLRQEDKIQQKKFGRSSKYAVAPEHREATAQ